MTPAERLTLALELSDLCADLAAAGRAVTDPETLGCEALAAMKLRAGGPQDLVDAARLETLPGFDQARFTAWKKRLRVRD
jgi:hypothetical protein